jgi:hypothetical protein
MIFYTLLNGKYLRLLALSPFVFFKIKGVVNRSLERKTTDLKNLETVLQTSLKPS